MPNSTSPSSHTAALYLRRSFEELLREVKARHAGGPQGPALLQLAGLLQHVPLHLRSETALDMVHREAVRRLHDILSVAPVAQVGRDSSATIRTA